MIKYMLIVLVVLLVGMNLNNCTDNGPFYIEYKYVNKSSHDVRFETSSEFRGTIIKGDSASITYAVPVPPDDLFFLDSSFVVSFTFLSEPEMCLTYSGGITDTLDDPRSEQTLYIGGSRCVYTIDDSLYFKADTCQ